MKGLENAFKCSQHPGDDETHKANFENSSLDVPLRADEIKPARRERKKREPTGKTNYSAKFLEKSSRDMSLICSVWSACPFLFLSLEVNLISSPSVFGAVREIFSGRAPIQGKGNRRDRFCCPLYKQQHNNYSTTKSLSSSSSFESRT